MLRRPKHSKTEVVAPKEDEESDTTSGAAGLLEKKATL
jgi:hypothetical protein